MNHQQGMNSDLTVGGRRLHVQTSFSPTVCAAITNIFDEGRVAEAHEVKLPKKLADDKLQEKLQEIHQKVVRDLELLFFISEKVRQVKHPISCNKLGLVFLKKGFYEEAIEFFNLAIQVDSSFAEAYNNLGLAHLEQKNASAAEEAFRKGLEVAKDYADLHLNLGRVYLQKAAYADAIRSFDTALELNPSYFEAHFFMAKALLESLVKKVDDGHLPPASVRDKRIKHHFARAAELFRPLANDAFEQTSTAIEQKDYESALKYIEHTFHTAEPQMDMTFDHDFYLKFMYGGKGKDNQFIGSYVEQLQEAINHFPEYADLHNNLGIAYLIMCRNLFLKALDEFRKAIKINPKFKKAKKNLKLAENDGKGFLILLRAILK